MFEFRMLALGASLVLHAEGREHVLGPPKEQLILAILLLSPGRTVTVDAIVDHVWAERPPPKARDALASYVSRLRRRLRDALGDKVRIVARGSTYLLAVEAEAVDLHRFRNLRRQAKAILESGDPEHAVRLFRAAEELWPGDALAGLPGAWARRMARTLGEERRDVQRERVELELRMGRHAEVLDELHHLLALHPTDETIAAHLMTALYRSDRRVDALGVYRRIRRDLVTETATEPGQRLRDLHRRILGGDSDLAVTPVYRRGGVKPQPNTLPRDVPHFTGREPEIDAVNAMRRGHSGNLVVAIQGMPGVGKSALGTHIAHALAAHYPDAHLYLDLRAHDPVRPPLDAAAALFALLRMLDVPASRIPRSLGERASVWHAELAYRRTIVVLDDAAGPEQVRPLISASSPGLTLVTSRARFDGVADVRSVSLGVLPASDAVKLVRRLAGEDTEPGKVDEVVRLCGGLPLAITLRAGRITTGPSESASLLPGSSGTAHGLDGDNREIDSAFELSYRDLTTRQRLVFRRLGLHPCREATVVVAAVLGDVTVAQAQEVVDVLLRHHLLQEVRPARYRFHDLIRAYARERAWRDDSESENRRAVTRLLDHYRRAVETAVQTLEPGGEAGEADRGDEGESSASPGRRWLEEEWSDVLQLAEYAAAHEWKGHCARLMRLMAGYLDTEGHWEDAAAGHGLALRACRELGDVGGVAQASLDLGFARFRTGWHEEALRHTREALVVYRSIGDRHAEARTLDQIGFISWASARYREALAHHEEAGAIFRAMRDTRGEADALGHSGIVYWHLGRYQGSLDLFGRALAAYRRVGDRRGEAKTLNNMGDVQRHRGYHRDAVELYQESLKIFKEIAGRQNHAILHKNLGDVHQYKGEFASALECYRTAMTTFQETGDRRSKADILNSIGSTYLRMGAPGESMVHFQRAEELADEIADLYEKVRALVGIADVHSAAGAYTPALDVCREALAIARTIGDLYHEAQVHKRMADVFFYLRDSDSARIFWRQALYLFDYLDLLEAEEVRIRLQALGGVL
ncbi:AfsR/SARP family transcriptional regulator [Streptosporangium carneum]|uniref:SARP family transcriptional regulator n=1 Tax=Streptosporangium carneum TaxID=47481 RepID=A0A9W6IB06_9ACTN|nr:tetratricopeptide repeat protein [Streptosporangium carneum]GLK14165.1 SARP family transcriptional regulator [Streptosporangium carneum]